MASAGDTITLPPSVYVDTGTTIDKNLILQGDGADQSIVHRFSKARLAPILIVAPGVTAELRGLRITGGSGQMGGGIRNYGTLTISDSEISGNTAASGGGIWTNGVLNIFRSTISNNTATGASSTGGGLYVAGGTVSVYDSAITGNAASKSGGGIQNGSASDPGGTAVKLQNTTVSGNRTAFAGPGSAIAKAGGGMQLEFTTVYGYGDSTYGEVAHALIAIGSGSSLLASHSLIVTPGTYTPACYLAPALTGTNTPPAGAAYSLGHNLVSDASCALNDPTDLANNPNARLGPLQLNAPGKTATHALLPGSAAIDAGGSGLSYIDQDQRGAPRLDPGRACDIGAYELRAPEATADSYRVAEGGTLEIAAPGLLGNDHSPEGLPLHAILVDPPSHGIVPLVVTGIAPDGGFTYWPWAGFVGQDSFTYRVSDGVHESAPVTVTIMVQDANHVPVAAPDFYNAVAGQTLEVDAFHGVLYNDTDPDLTRLSAVKTVDPEHGQADFRCDGSFSYTPEPDFTGTDRFGYEASDGQAASDPMTVFIEVAANDSPPNLQSSSITIQLDVRPDGPTDFQFSGALGDFTLDDTAADDGDLYGRSRTFPVPPGLYTVEEQVPAGWIVTDSRCDAPAGVQTTSLGSELSVTVDGGTSVTCTFVTQRPAKLIAGAYADQNRNHRKDRADSGLEGWKLRLYSLSGKLVAKRITNSRGQAVFPRLQPGGYTLCEEDRAGWEAISPPTLHPDHQQLCDTVNIGSGQKLSTWFGNSGQWPGVTACRTDAPLPDPKGQRLHRSTT